MGRCHRKIPGTRAPPPGDGRARRSLSKARTAESNREVLFARAVDLPMRALVSSCGGRACVHGRLRAGVAAGPRTRWRSGEPDGVGCGDRREPRPARLRPDPRSSCTRRQGRLARTTSSTARTPARASDPAVAPRRPGATTGPPNERPTVDQGAASPERLGKERGPHPPPPSSRSRRRSGSPRSHREALALVLPDVGREPFAEGEAPGDETAPPGLRPVPLVAGAATGPRSRARSGRPRPPRWCGRRGFFFSLLPAPGSPEPSVRRATGSGGWARPPARTAAAFLRLLVPQVVDAALDQIFDQLVAERRCPARPRDTRSICGPRHLPSGHRRQSSRRILTWPRPSSASTSETSSKSVERVTVDLGSTSTRTIASVASRPGAFSVRRPGRSRMVHQPLVRRLDLMVNRERGRRELDLRRLESGRVLGSMTNQTVGGDSVSRA